MHSADAVMDAYLAHCKVHTGKSDSDLKACLDYYEDPARSCENLNFCFSAQTEPFY